ncbi:hypothetical protein ABPG72_008361 [Tetrahymena utriculariae]
MSKSKSQAIKGFLQNLSSIRGESLYQSFLLGTAYIKYKLSEQALQELTQGLEQFVQLTKQMKRTDLIEELYSQILEGNQKQPIKAIELLTEKIFQQDSQIQMKQDFNNNEEELFQSMMQEEQRQELERQKQDEYLARLAAQEMEEEERKVFDTYKQIQKEDEQSWKCEICLEQMTDQQFWPLQCRHQFHRDCLQQYFNVKIKDRSFPLKCPNESCKQEVDYSDIKEILTKQEFQKYEEFSLNNYIDSNLEELSWCPSAGCKYAFVLEENQTLLICPLCRKKFCLTCKCEFHKNQTCKEYQISNTYDDQDKRFEQFVRGQKFKQCINCKMWVERNQGCDHMTCRCGCQFCYKCGGPYLKCACHGYNN